MTNGDRIRQSTNEELAERMAMDFDCNICPFSGQKRGCDGNCELGALKWLKQEEYGDKNAPD